MQYQKGDLRVEMEVAREKVEREETNVVWTDSKSQLADIFTNKGVSRRNLTDILEVCKLPL